MKPWFIQEDNVIPFPKKDTSVVRLPNVNAYPDFLSGVQDLQNHLKQGDISSDIHKKLYQDLIHRFMKTESFETPWFLREAPADAGITGLGVSQQPAITPNQGGISSLSPIGKDRAQKLNRIVNKLKADPEFIDQIFDQLSAKTKDVEGQFVNRFIQMLDPKLTNPEEDQTFGGFLKSFAEIIAEIPGSNEEKFQFVNTLGKVSHIDISKLLQPTANWDSWLVGTPFSKKLFEQCFNDPRLRTNLKGPGEAALAILSPSIKLMTEAGDIEINKQKVEVKGGESAKGGRLTPTKNVVGQVDAAWIRKNIFNNNKKAVVPNNTSHLNFVETLVKPNNMSAEQIERLLSSIFLQPALKKEIAKISKKTLNITSQDLFKLGLLNYSYSQNDNNFLILTRDVRKSIYFSINDWERAYQNIAISFAITGSDSRSTGIPQLGVKSKTV